MHKLVGAIVFSTVITLTVKAQDVSDVNIPDPIFVPESSALASLRAWSLEKWLSVRRTNHPLYHYALGTTRFQAYLQYCKRHSLNIDMPVLSEMALGNLSEIIAAHYEETELVKLKGLSENEIRVFLADLSRDIYAFEYATALKELEAAKALADMTPKAYCDSIAKKNQDGYIALRATAKRKLGR